jgi:hypothetical protein
MVCDTGVWERLGWLESIYLVHIAWRDCMSFASICLHEMRRDEYEDRINEENLHLLSAPFVLNV